MFKLFSTSDNSNSRIFYPGFEIELSPDVWEFRGIFSIDELPKEEFPVFVMDGINGFDLLETTEKAVKVKSECGLTFFVPKSGLFRNGGLNINYFYSKARIDRDRFINRVRGLE